MLQLAVKIQEQYNGKSYCTVMQIGPVIKDQKVKDQSFSEDGQKIKGDGGVV